MAKINTSIIGNAAEGFMVYRLSIWGYNVSQAPPGCSYDLICDTKDALLRIQVKGCKSPSYNGRGTSHSYKFDASRGREKREAYDLNDWDILACVALPIGRCLFELPSKTNRSYSKSPSLFSAEAELQSWRNIIKKYGVKNGPEV